MLDKIKEKIANKELSYADLAHMLGICEMSARNKVSGKTAFSKLELEKLGTLLNEEVSNGIVSM